MSMKHILVLPILSLSSLTGFALAGEETTLRVPDAMEETSAGTLVAIVPTEEAKTTVKLIEAGHTTSLLVGNVAVKDVQVEGESIVKGKTHSGKTFVLVGAD